MSYPRRFEIRNFKKLQCLPITGAGQYRREFSAKNFGDIGKFGDIVTFGNICKVYISITGAPGPFLLDF